ncbi:nicotinic acid mononucleotide adenyltransferase [Hyunsoonleella sp. 2307UL5-6]|uniref:nicotinic acid mononucleotide adenyltransferase n=1 Tax=Hyunsoonleella sp. 2307UL5-6 TaxID=3384768 RepID=UPI0039BC2FC7
MKKYITILAALMISATVFAQKERTLTLNKETNLIDVVYYHDNGDVSQTGSYTADGKLEGQWLSFNKEGEKTVTAYYKDGKKVGKWIYVIDGKIKEVDYSKNIVTNI